MIDFVRFRYLYFFLSLLVIVPGCYSLARFGLKLSVDFTGGTILEISSPNPLPLGEIKKFFEKKEIPVVSFQRMEGGRMIIRTKPLEREKRIEVKKEIEKSFPKISILSEQTVGPTLGKELLVKAIGGMVLSLLLIVVFLAFRFNSFKFGLCAILAMLHDTFVMLGSFSLLGHFFQVEVDTLFVTAVLTVLSGSVHDTVVIYERIREILREREKISLKETVNIAINETLVRSINNSLTILFVLFALFLLGGETIKWFTAALLIGIISGTYSSTFIAAPLLVVWERLSRKLRR